MSPEPQRQQSPKLLFINSLHPRPFKYLMKMTKAKLGYGEGAVSTRPVWNMSI